jgi:hypothetical protein
VLVTISHAVPYGIGDGPTLMRAFFKDSNIDYMSPQLYTTGGEGANDFSATMGVQWAEYPNCKAKVVPSIVRAAMTRTPRRGSRPSASPPWATSSGRESLLRALRGYCAPEKLLRT